MATVSEQLRVELQRTVKNGATVYRIAKDARVDWHSVNGYIDGTRDNLYLPQFDQLCEYMGLHLVKRTSAKQQAKRSSAAKNKPRAKKKAPAAARRGKRRPK